METPFLDKEIEWLEWAKNGTSWNTECEKQLDEYKAIKQALSISNIVESNPNEKATLKHAVDAIYFADNSDYLSGLYGVVRSLTGLDEPTEEDIKKLFEELKNEKIT